MVGKTARYVAMAISQTWLEMKTSIKLPDEKCLYFNLRFTVLRNYAQKQLEVHDIWYRYYCRHYEVRVSGVFTVAVLESISANCLWLMQVWKCNNVKHNNVIVMA